MRRLLAFAIIVASLIVSRPVNGQANGCAVQVFSGTTLRYTIDYGATYYPATSILSYVLRGVYACPITAPVTLGMYQQYGFMVDQNAIVVWSSADGLTYYVHREHRVFALTAAQWQQIVMVVNLKVVNKR